MNSLFGINKFRNDSEYRALVYTTVSGIFLLASWFGWFKDFLPIDVAWVSIVISGTPILKGAIVGLFTRFDIKAGVLVSIALIASISIGEYFAAGEIAFIMMLGEILENRTVRKAQENVKKLLQLAPQTARIRTSDGELEIPIEQIKADEILLVKPGESIPVDGIIISGQTAINQSIITGESMPVDKSVGDDVFVGTINQLGAIEIKATKVGEDTSLSKLIRLIKESEGKKAPVVRIADKWATAIVPMALLLSIITYFATQDITRAVTILVVFCPCALVLATPTAIMAGIGNASKKGILIKSGEALEKVAKLNTIAFDKTGTITYGRPEVTDVLSLSNEYADELVLKMAAVAEKFSEHPLGKAITAKSKELPLYIDDPEEFRLDLGQGVIARYDNKKVLVGNRKLLKCNQVVIDSKIKEHFEVFESEGKTVMAVAVEDEVIGLITVMDKIKAKSRSTIEKLRSIGIRNLMLITGDNEITASSIGRQVGIEKIYSEQLPEDKLKVIQEQISAGKNVCMVGDGINDAPALAISDIGVAMGALGADIAIETADIALMSDDISKVPELILLSRRVLKTITVNVFISMGINFGAILLAAFGLINPVIGALVHNFGSVLVIAISATLLKYRISVKEQSGAVLGTVHDAGTF